MSQADKDRIERQAMDPSISCFNDMHQICDDLYHAILRLRERTPREERPALEFQIAMAVNELVARIAKAEQRLIDKGNR